MFPRPRYDFLDDTGTSTVEYALITLAAAAFATGLFIYINSDSVRNGIADLVDRALAFSS